MTRLLRLARGAFVVRTHGSFRVGSVDQPMHAWDVSPGVAASLLCFSSPTALDEVLEGRPEQAARQLTGFVETLLDYGILEAGSGESSIATPRTAQFELIRYIAPYRDIAATDSEFLALYDKVRKHTLTSVPQAYATFMAARHVIQQHVPGALVEGGVWRGGSMMLVAHTLLMLGATDRELWLYDTFEYLWEPRGTHDGTLWVPTEGNRQPRDGDRETAPRPTRPTTRSPADVSIEAVGANLATTGYPRENVRLVAGLVQDTIPGEAPEVISVLRLDTDFYDSTLHQLRHLYPRLAVGGVLIVDDYGKHEGATRATDDYFRSLGHSPMLVRVDVQGRIAVKHVPTVSVGAPDAQDNLKRPRGGSSGQPGSSKE